MTFRSLVKVCVGVAVGAVMAASAPAESTPRCAIVPFDPLGTVTAEEAVYVSSRFASTMEEVCRYDVPDVSRVREAMAAEIKAGTTARERAIEVGKVLRVDYVCFGTFAKIGGLCTLDTKLLEVETRSVISSARTDYQGTVEDFARNGLTANIEELVKLQSTPPQAAAPVPAATPAPSMPVAKQPDSRLSAQPAAPPKTQARREPVFSADWFYGAGYGKYGTGGAYVLIRPSDWFGIEVGAGMWFERYNETRLVTYEVDVPAQGVPGDTNFVAASTDERTYEEREKGSASAAVIGIEEHFYLTPRQVVKQHSINLGQYYSDAFGLVFSLAYGFEYHSPSGVGWDLSIGASVAPQSDDNFADFTGTQDSSTDFEWNPLVLEAGVFF